MSKKDSLQEGRELASEAGMSQSEFDKQSYDHLTSEEATAFFSEFYHGAHHIPGKVKAFGRGWAVTHDRGDLATYDYDQLTRLVIMAHDKCYRVGIMPYNFNSLKIAIWKRKRTGAMDERHPTMEDAILSYRPKPPAQ